MSEIPQNSGGEAQNTEVETTLKLLPTAAETKPTSPSEVLLVPNGVMPVQTTETPAVPAEVIPAVNEALATTPLTNASEEIAVPIEVNTPNTENKTNNVVNNSTTVLTPEVEKQNVTTSTNNQISENNTKESGDWNQRESELLKIIDDLEKVKTDGGIDALRLELKAKEEEIELLKAKVKTLETELQASLCKPGTKSHEMIETIKQQHEELLTKARGMIFDKTKMVKNQELQIEALNTQVQSLKDINGITKDMLSIRNAEVKSLEERLQVMETRFKTEKERFELMLKKADTSSSLNADLKKEYETQLAIFKELRAKYEERVQALVAENNQLKNSAQGSTSA